MDDPSVAIWHNQYGDADWNEILWSVSLPMLRHFSRSIRKDYPLPSTARPLFQFGRPVAPTEVRILGGYEDAHKALIGWMEGCYQRTFVDALPHFEIVLHAKIMQAIDILDVELLKGEGNRLLRRLEIHRFSVDEAGDIHNLHNVSPVIQNKLYENIADNFVKGSLLDRRGFLWLAYLEEDCERGVRRAIRLLEQNSSTESGVSAEELWVEGVTANEGRLDDVLPTLYNGLLRSGERDPNIAKELYDRGFSSNPRPPQAKPHVPSLEDDVYFFRPYQTLSEGTSRTASIDTPSTGTSETARNAWGNGKHGPRHLQQTRFGKGRQGAVTEATPAGGYLNNSNPFRFNMDGPSVEGTTHSEKKINDHDARAGTTSGNSDAFAATNNARPSQPVSSYNQYLPAAYHAPPYPYLSNYGCPSYSYYPTCNHPSHSQGAAFNHHIPGQYPHPSPPPPYAGQNSHLPGMYSNTLPNVDSGPSTNAYNTSGNRDPWNAEMIEKSNASAPGQQNRDTSNASENDSRNNGWADVARPSNGQPQEGAWGATNPESFYAGWDSSAQQFSLNSSNENNSTGSGRWINDPNLGRVFESTPRWGEPTIKLSGGPQMTQAEPEDKTEWWVNNNHGNKGGFGRKVHFN